MVRAGGRLMDEALPWWDVGECHQRLVAAPVDVVWRALADLVVADLPLAGGLMRVRALGRNMLGPPDRRVLDALPPGEVARREPHELLLAMVSPTSALRPMSSGPELQPGTMAELHRPLPDGWVRVAVDFRLGPDGDGTWLTTETRVLATGPRAKRVFGLYWAVIRAGSGLVRVELLRAVARRAERAGVPDLSLIHI